MSDSLIAVAKEIARRTLAVDLADSPLYVISPREGSLLDKDTLGPREGLFIPDADSLFRPQLERDGQWEGPGVCVIVDENAEAAAELDEEDKLRWLVGLILHECCHWLDKPLQEPAELPVANAIVALVGVKLSLRASQRDPVDDVFEATASYRVHGQSFTRLAVHAWHRACTIGGLALGPTWLAFGDVYPGLWLADRPYDYVHALHDELATYPLTRKLRFLNSHYDCFDPPPAYVEMWRAADERIKMFERRLSPQKEKSQYATINR